MQMVWWQEKSSDDHARFVSYLGKVCQLSIFDSPRQIRQKEIIRDLIIPTLTEGEGHIPEDMDRIQDLGQRWRMTNGQLADTIHKCWKKMVTPMNAQQAGLLVKRSAGTMRRWAREDIIHADTDRKTGHWSFTREVLIDKIH